MSSRVEVLGLLVGDMKNSHWIESAYTIINTSFLGTYESLDDFLWETSIEATNLLLPSLDFGPATQYSEHQINTLKRFIVNKITLKAQYCLSELSMNYGR